MSDTLEHTPGPWEYDTIEGQDENAYTYHVILDPNGDNLIGSCREIYNDLIAFNDADWHLVAAAPDMLEALKRVRSTMSSKCTSDGCTCGDGWQHDDPEVIAKIDAVIAKAEGK
jgi:hypothetical protein